MFLTPLIHGTKIPLAGGSWKDRMSANPLEHAIWLEQGFNVAMPVAENGRVVVDYDRKDAARAFWKKFRDLCTVVVETRRGVHFHFSGSTATRKFEHGDVKGNGFVLMPPSVVAGHKYVFVRQGDLHPFPEHLFPPRPAPGPVIAGIAATKIKNIRAYIRKIPSISGMHGHDAAFRVACVLRDAGFSEMDALAEMVLWDEVCASPKWGPVALAKKIRDAYRVILKGDSDG